MVVPVGQAEPNSGERILLQPSYRPPINDPLSAPDTDLVGQTAIPYFYRPSWTRTDPASTVPVQPTTWLVFMDELGLGIQIVTQLRGAEHAVIEVTAGKAFKRLTNQRYTIRPAVRADYDALLWDIQNRGRWPRKILHLWSVSPAVPNSIDETLELSFFSLLNLAQALADNSVTGVDIAVVTSSLQSVGGEQIVSPERAALFGPLAVIPKEIPNITCRGIDCDFTAQRTSYLAIQIINEHYSPFQDPLVAFRGRYRFINSAELFKAGGSSPEGKLRRNGVYFITGGLGKTGLAVATYLARNCAARVMLFDQKNVAPSYQWKDDLLSENTAAAEKAILRQLVAIQECGGEVRTVRGDVTKAVDMLRAISFANSEFGKVEGVIHVMPTSENLMSNAKTPESAGNLLRNSIQGLQVLTESLRAESPDFIFALSSAVHLKARPDRVDRVSANNFLKAYVKSGLDAPVFAVECDFLPSESAATLNQIGPEPFRAEGINDVLLFDNALELLLSTAGLPPTVLCNRNEFASLGRKNPGQAVEEQLCGWWQEFLGLDHVDLDDDFFELGGHSLTGLQLFSEINKTYGLDLGLSTLFEMRTVRELAKCIRHAQEAGTDEPFAWSPLVPIQPKGNLRPLFVISGLGGNVVKFHNLSVLLGDNQPMYGLLPRGIDGKDSFHTQIEDIAADYVTAIRTTQPEGPYHLAGYSFGGIVAFEVAQQIVATGGQVALLALFDTIEWHYLQNANTTLSPRERLKSLYEEFRRDTLETSTVNYFIKRLNKKFSKRTNGEEIGDSSSLPSQLESIEQVNASAAAKYKPKVYPGRLTLFRSTKRVGQEGKDESLGWRGLAAGGIDVFPINSTHFDMLREPSVIELAEKLSRRLTDDAL
jgi:thioesterase domain-containing protein/acyl carrier protein/NAD(P)-dependent dehydrogenase (short-subunit alcohol dehydrogenase family)